MDNTKMILIASQKGGVGKTTTATNLAVALHALTQKITVLVDADHQGSDLDWAQVRKLNGKPETPYTIPSDVRDLPQLMVNAKSEGVAWVIVDTRGTTAPEIVEVMRMANFVIVPSTPSTIDVKAALKTIGLLDGISAPKVVLLTRVRKLFGVMKTRRVKTAVSAIQDNGGRMAPVMFSELVAFGDAYDQGLSVNEYEPGSEGAMQVTALAEFTCGALA